MIATATTKRFLEAVRDQKVEAYLRGEPKYFVPAPNAYDEPQNFGSAYDSELLPIWWRTHNRQLFSIFGAGLKGIIDHGVDRGRDLFCASQWLWHYYWRRRKGETEPGSRYGDMFGVDGPALAAKFVSELSANKEALVLDKRWAGEEWNSDTGLWGPICDVCADIADNQGGPEQFKAVRRAAL